MALFTYTEVDEGTLMTVKDIPVMIKDKPDDEVEGQEPDTCRSSKTNNSFTTSPGPRRRARVFSSAEPRRNGMHKHRLLAAAMRLQVCVGQRWNEVTDG